MSLQIFPICYLLHFLIFTLTLTLLYQSLCCCLSFRLDCLIIRSNVRLIWLDLKKKLLLSSWKVTLDCDKVKSKLKWKYFYEIHFASRDLRSIEWNVCVQSTSCAFLCVILENCRTTTITESEQWNSQSKRHSLHKTAMKLLRSCRHCNQLFVGLCLWWSLYSLFNWQHHFKKINMHNWNSLEGGTSSWWRKIMIITCCLQPTWLMQIRFH